MGDYYHIAYINEHKQILLIDRTVEDELFPFEKYNVSSFHYAWFKSIGVSDGPIVGLPNELNTIILPLLHNWYCHKDKFSKMFNDFEKQAFGMDYVTWPIVFGGDPHVGFSEDDGKVDGICWQTKDEFRRSQHMQRITQQSIKYANTDINRELELYRMYKGQNVYSYTLLNNNSGPTIAEEYGFYGGDFTKIVDMIKNGLVVSASSHAKDGNWKLAKIKKIYYR